MPGFFSYLPKIEYTPTRIRFQFTNQDFVLATNIFKGLSLDNSAYATDLFTEFSYKTVLDQIKFLKQFMVILIMIGLFY